jgi:hypothetical protein
VIGIITKNIAEAVDEEASFLVGSQNDHLDAQIMHDCGTARLMKLFGYAQLETASRLK